MVKCLCLLSIMAEHCAAMTNGMDAFMRAFFLNGFSFASGYVYVHRPGFRQMIKKKAVQLLIPWFVFSNFIIVSSYIFSFSDKHTNIVHDLVMNMLQIHYSGDEMWFIAAIFMSFIPLYFFVKAYENSKMSVAKKNTVFILLALAFSAASLAFASFIPPETFPWGVPGTEAALPWHLEYMFQAMFFMFLGYIFRQCWEERFRVFDRPLPFIILVGLYLLGVYAPSIFHFAFSDFGTFVASYPRAILGIAFIVALSRLLPSTRFSDFVGQSTLAYYGLHGKVFSFLNVVGRRFFPALWLRACFGTELEHVIGSVVIVMLTAVILIVPTMIINRFFPFAVGKHRKKNI